MTFTPFPHNRFIVKSGPVKSGKTRDLEAELDAASDSGLMDVTHILVVKHPKDDPENPDSIGKHKVLVTDDPDVIANAVKDNTSNVVIAGLSHYKAPDIVQLVDALIRSGRAVMSSALNLDFEGKPWEHLPELMAIADSVELKKGICYSCGDESTRSIKIDSNFYPVCTHHYHYINEPKIENGSKGHLELFLGNMYASKSKRWKEKIDETELTGLKYFTFKWLNDDRGRNDEEKKKPFDTDSIKIRNGGEVPAILVRDAEDIKNYIRSSTKNRQVKRIFIDEMQFIQGMYDLAFELLAQRYRIYGTGLIRPFKRTEFGDVPKLMCLADTINMQYAYCKKCYRPSGENQRLIINANGNHLVADFNDPIVAVQGKNYDYQASCLSHIELPNEPPLKYSFPEFSLLKF